MRIYIVKVTDGYDANTLKIFRNREDAENYKTKLENEQPEEEKRYESYMIFEYNVE